MSSLDDSHPQQLSIVENVDTRENYTDSNVTTDVETSVTKEPETSVTNDAETSITSNAETCVTTDVESSITTDAVQSCDLDKLVNLAIEHFQLKPQGPTSRKIHQCNLCGKLFTTPSHLKTHARIHTDSRPFKCQHSGCDRSFNTSYSLTVHTRSHSNERPYPCTIVGERCSKKFKTSGDLAKHVRTHTGVKPFACEFADCSRTFTTSNIRKLHMRTHTGERPHACDKCSKTFRSQTNLKCHLRIHSGYKPYICEHEGCEKSFTEYSSLYKHQVVHTLEKPYSCTDCNNTYRQASTLALHRRVTHRVNAEMLAFADDYDSVATAGGSGVVVAQGQLPAALASTSIALPTTPTGHPQTTHIFSAIANQTGPTVTGYIMVPITNLQPPAQQAADNSNTSISSTEELIDVDNTNSEITITDSDSQNQQLVLSLVEVPSNITLPFPASATTATIYEDV